ncbi:hydroxymethylbilane synthase [uncultured Mailhella sp.]|uniref:hydroxymethylbilane synthase n=1 Tax=uncultured Mailhella sp. TaxID=1981031 RepID=UPI00261A5C0F|nr:hydroxymethylbilane synthase [uncultured Mailhella sp.]
MKKMVIATRGSALALWQAEHIRSQLRQRYPALDVDLLVLKTRGDVILDVPLAKVGGKGLFVKEIEEALLSGQADLAVHSMKDVPMILPEGLVLGAVPEREICTDLFLSEKYAALHSLPRGAVVGTSSLRRQAQVLALRPDLQVTMLRGNVETRLRKMKEGRYDAVILASAGVKRLGLAASFQEELAPPAFLPAVGQGALGVEIRAGREDVQSSVAFLEHEPTRLCVSAERAFLRRLDGGCQVPIAAHAVLNGEELTLSGLVADPQGQKIFRGERRGRAAPESAGNLGTALAEELLNQGAGAVLRELYSAE